MAPSCKEKTAVLKEDLRITHQDEIAPRIFKMTLSGEIEKMDERLFRCHNSVLINLNNVIGSTSS